MPRNSRGDVSERSIPTGIPTAWESKGTIPQTPPSLTTAKACPFRLACPVSGCLLVFKGETPYRYLKRHLKDPGIYGRMGPEKEAWLYLHKVEHERVLAALEGSESEEERNSRTAEFELRAKNMGIAEEKFVAQKVAIWEGMWAAEQMGNDIQYNAGILLDAATSANQ